MAASMRLHHQGSIKASCYWNERKSFLSVTTTPLLHRRMGVHVVCVSAYMVAFTLYVQGVQARNAHQWWTHVCACIYMRVSMGAIAHECVYVCMHAYVHMVQETEKKDREKTSTRTHHPAGRIGHGALEQEVSGTHTGHREGHRRRWSVTPESGLCASQRQRI